VVKRRLMELYGVLLAFAGVKWSYTGGKTAFNGVILAVKRRLMASNGVILGVIGVKRLRMESNLRRNSV